METPNTQKTPALSTHIAGIPHRRPDLAVLHIGDAVAIQHEPDNKFDPNALKVNWSGWTGKRCPTCNGLGVEQADGEEVRCQACAGTGDEHVTVHLGYIPRLETGVWQRFAVAYITEIVPDRKWTEVEISTIKPE